MYLVDTSVWVDFIRGKPGPAVEQLRAVLKTEQSAGINPLIYQEILQGAESEQRFTQFRDYFKELNFYHPKDTTDSCAQAAHLYFSCRRQGITIRSTIDCLIAQTAIEYDLILLHSDKDFMRIAEVAPVLKLFPA